MMLVALIMRAMLPQGWMPSQGGEGLKGTFTICSVTGSVRLTLDSNGNPVPADPEDGSAHQPCAFASLASLALPAADAVAQQPVGFVVATRPATPPSVYDRRSSGPTGARAPPALSRQA